MFSPTAYSRKPVILVWDNAFLVSIEFNTERFPSPPRKREPRQNEKIPMDHGRVLPANAKYRLNQMWWMNILVKFVSQDQWRSFTSKGIRRTTSLRNTEEKIRAIYRTHRYKCFFRPGRACINAPQRRRLNRSSTAITGGLYWPRSL